MCWWDHCMLSPNQCWTQVASKKGPCGLGYRHGDPASSRVPCSPGDRTLCALVLRQRDLCYSTTLPVSQGSSVAIHCSCRCSGGGFPANTVLLIGDGCKGPLVWMLLSCSLTAKARVTLTFVLDSLAVHQVWLGAYKCL